MNTGNAIKGKLFVHIIILSKFFSDLMPMTKIAHLGPEINSLNTGNTIKGKLFNFDRRKMMEKLIDFGLSESCLFI